MRATILATAALQLLCVVAFWIFWGLRKQVGTPPIILTVSLLIVAIGLLMRKNWARALTRALGVLMVVIGGGATIVIFRGDWEQHAREFLILVALSAVTTGIGFWWFWIFRASKSRDYFLPNISAVANTKSVRPLSISVIAIIMILCLLTLPFVFVYVDMKAFPFMGVLFEGRSANLVFTLWGLVHVPLGFGLWYLKEWARIGTLALLGVGFIGQAVSIFTGAYDSYSMIIAQQANRTPASHSGWFPLISSAIFIGAPVYFLITRRAAFQKAK